MEGKSCIHRRHREQRGIITLLSDNVKVVEECNIGNEAHICALQIMENNELLTVIMANIHVRDVRKKEG